MKKILSVLLASVMVLALLAGCSSKPSGEESKAPENSNVIKLRKAGLHRKVRSSFL